MEEKDLAVGSSGNGRKPGRFLLVYLVMACIIMTGTFLVSSIELDYSINEPSERSDSYGISFEATSSASMRCVGPIDYEISELSHDVRWDAGPDFEFEFSLDYSPEEVTAEATVIIDTERGEIEGASASMTVNIHNLIQVYCDAMTDAVFDQGEIDDAIDNEQKESGICFGI